MRIDLRGVMVTGAAGGLGRAVVLGLADRMVPTICVDSNADALAKVVAEAERRGARASPVVFDLTDEASIDAGFAQIAAADHPLDGIVTCAGVINKTKVLDLTVDEWDFVMNVNLRGTFLCIQRALRVMIPQGRGRIVTVASDTGKRGGGRLSTSAYGASKGGVVTLTRSLARELAVHHGAIRVNGLCPGPMWTGMHESMTADEKAIVETSVLMGRFGKPEEIAAGVLFLLSEEASFVYGETLVVDGGVVLD
jgi:NAD(P)-dependent dehydrogenase (short-subunit alcohol dehydrogenase family)